MSLLGCWSRSEKIRPKLGQEWREGMYVGTILQVELWLIGGERREAEQICWF